MGSRTSTTCSRVLAGVSVAALAAAALLALPAPAAADERHAVLGYSQQGRTIRVHRFGDFSSPRKILVVGCIHGNECQGIKITRRLARAAHPAGLDLWVVHLLNPDGHRLGVRQNGRGVDLNRNFGSQWIPIGRRWDPTYSGPRPWSERETRLARGLIRRVRPDVTIWYHQPQAVVRAWGPSRATARRYARLAREPYRSLRWPNGSAPNWQNHAFPGAASFVVELPAGALSDARAARHARAVRRLLTP
jgi:murein peptide amidase A